MKRYIFSNTENLKTINYKSSVNRLQILQQENFLDGKGVNEDLSLVSIFRKNQGKCMSFPLNIQVVNCFF